MSIEPKCHVLCQITLNMSLFNVFGVSKNTIEISTAAEEHHCPICQLLFLELFLSRGYFYIICKLSMLTSCILRTLRWENLYIFFYTGIVENEASVFKLDVYL